jgi:hypothetical protein
VLVSAKHPLARRRSLDLPALRDLPFILFETGFALTGSFSMPANATASIPSRRPEQPDRFHRGTRRRRSRHRVLAPHDRRPAQAFLGEAHPAVRTRHRLAYRHDLAPRRLFVPRRECLARARAPAADQEIDDARKPHSQQIGQRLERRQRAYRQSEIHDQFHITWRTP